MQLCMQAPLTLRPEGLGFSASNMGFPRTRGTILGVFIIRLLVFGGLYWGALFWEATI